MHVASSLMHCPYPYFYNSVISRRISEELELDILEPYIEIKEIIEITEDLNSEKININKTKIYDEKNNISEVTNSIIKSLPILIDKKLELFSSKVNES